MLAAAVYDCPVLHSLQVSSHLFGRLDRIESEYLGARWDRPTTQLFCRLCCPDSKEDNRCALRDFTRLSFRSQHLPKKNGPQRREPIRDLAF